MKQKLICIILLISLYSCFDRYDNNDLIISNQSNTSIYTVISQSDTIFDYEKFLIRKKIEQGETINSIDITGLFISDEILPNSKEEIIRPRVWKDYINKSKDKKIRLYFISKDSVTKYGWEHIHHYNVYNKKEILALDDLKTSSWEITYK